MSDIDEKIRHALSEEDKELLENFGEEAGLPELITKSFSGKMKPMVIMVWLSVIGFFCFAIFCAVQYFSTMVLLDRMTWATGFIWALIAISMMKIWYWMHLQNITMLRDIKRMELRIVSEIK